MKWEMSDDYASLLTTLIVAVFAVGTIQMYSLMKRWSDASSEQRRLFAEARVRVTEALHHGTQPSVDDLRAADKRRLNSFVSAHKWLPPYLAAGVWVAVVTALGQQQLRILKWAATAGDNPDPELARKSFYLVSGAVVLILAEGLIRVFTEALLKQRAYLKPLKGYPRTTRSRMNLVVKDYRRTGQLPSSPASTQVPPGPSTTSGTP